jgi:hypothetical protein
VNYSNLYYACKDLFPLKAKINTTIKRTQKTREKDLKCLFMTISISKVMVNKYRKSPTKNKPKVETNIKIEPSPTTTCFKVMISCIV